MLFLVLEDLVQHAAQAQILARQMHRIYSVPIPSSPAVKPYMYTAVHITAPHTHP